MQIGNSISILQMSENETKPMDVSILAKSLETIFFAEIIASELVSLNFPYEEQDTFHEQPMC